MLLQPSQRRLPNLSTYIYRRRVRHLRMDYRKAQIVAELMIMSHGPLNTVPASCKDISTNAPRFVSSQGNAVSSATVAVVPAIGP